MTDYFLDVYDMYVGEGEKNVKAIFSLAKKLSPCIVFIDEADAILGSRTGSSSRTAHREMINQFLREWDGMGELSAFIMVATNRPFDLDEASLRRLPRRLLVDLPTEEDREAILKIHLKGEILDPELSLANLASQTPFYSGSDLKNFVVAAALSCVREEVDNATSRSKEPPPPTADESAPSPPTETNFTKIQPSPYVYPEKRTLGPRHFTLALDEISASISEDMSSLVAIRKFDDKFGDRRGRRKKVGGYGFETVKEGERKLSDSARVRNRN
jgi:SpoVK/Ycf46/Vps4 family AAA+-type ATPase